MPKLKAIEDLHALRDRARAEMEARDRTATRIIVGMGTCGIAAGAGETMEAIQQELQKLNLDAHVSTVGCIGMCSKEPLVDIQEPARPRVTYANVQPEMVPRLIEEHLVHGRVIQEWAMGRVPPEGIGQA